jgi:hypothetical protein
MVVRISVTIRLNPKVIEVGFSCIVSARHTEAGLRLGLVNIVTARALSTLRRTSAIALILAAGLPLLALAPVQGRLFDNRLRGVLFILLGASELSSLALLTEAPRLNLGLYRQLGRREVR